MGQNARLRSLLTEALVAKTKYTNCYLASCVLHDSLMGPLVYVIVLTWTLWRRMLTTDIEDNGIFRHVLSQAVADPLRAFGPATAFCSYLEKINWSISPVGKCVDHNGFIFVLRHLRHSLFAESVMHGMLALGSPLNLDPILITGIAFESVYL